jgi:membrane fusion protein (multidrug efflux system)
MRYGLTLAVVWAVALPGCGKHADEGGDDMRKPPPLPAKPTPAAAKEAMARELGTTPTAVADAPRKDAPKKPAGPVVDVEAAKPLQKTVPVAVDYTGQTIGSETVEIRARVEGFLESIHFTEGEFVAKGDLLYEIDKDRAREVVEQAEGDLNVARADAEKAEMDVRRNLPLVEKNAIAREEYDTSVSARKAAQARVEAKEAALARAKINLGYATVRAPIAGLVGKTEVDIGNLVGRGEPTLLTTISKIDPIYAEVRISETDMLFYQRETSAGRRRRDEMPLALFFSDGSKHPQGGKIMVVDRNIDTKTGTILVQVSFPNTDQKVRPGQFARVQAVREVLKDALLVPQGAVEELQGTYRLYVLGEGDVAKSRSVKMGPRLGPLWIVTEGVGAGDRIVVEGRQKLRDGTTVRAKAMVIGEDGKLTPDPNAPSPAPAGEAPAGGGKN